MTATLRVRPMPDFGPDSRRLVIDCQHGTTTVDQYIPPTGSAIVLTERQMIALAAARHELEEGCGCARGLDTLSRSRHGAPA